MGKFRDYLSFCADVIQVTTFFGLTIAGLVAGLVMLIGYLTDIPWFWLAVGTPLAGLLMLLTVNICQKRKPTSVQIEDERKRFQEELKHKAYLNRLVLTGQSPSAPLKYAPPANAIPVGSLLIKDIGSRMIELSHHINSFIEHDGKNKSEQELVNGYHTRFASHLIYLYEEAERRGHQDADIKQYYEHPEYLVNVRHIASRIGAMGHRLQLYVD